MTAITYTSKYRTRVLASLAIVLTLVAGVCIGWAVSRRPHMPRGPGRPGEAGREAPSPSHMMAERLGLSQAQEKQVDSIFEARRKQIGAFWDGPGAQLRHIVDSTSSDIRAVLDSTQREKFDKMQERRGGMMGPGGPGRPHRPDDRRGEAEHGPPPPRDR